MSIAEKLQAIVENQQAVYDAGRKSEYDRFWDAYQHNGTRTDYANGFCGGWTDELFKPKYDIVLIENNTQCFAKTEIRNLAACIKNAGITFDTSKATSLSYMFNNARTLEEVPNIDVSNCTSIGWLFNMCTSLKKASVTFGANKTTSYSNVFARCDNLEELTVAGVIDIPLSLPNSSKLTNASVQSIIDCLAYLTEDTTQTLTLHSDVKYTTSQKDVIVNQKKWTLVGGTEVADDYFDS